MNNKRKTQYEYRAHSNDLYISVDIIKNGEIAKTVDYTKIELLDAMSFLGEIGPKTKLANVPTERLEQEAIECTKFNIDYVW